MKNVGTNDAMIRIGLAVLLCCLYLFNVITGITAVVLLSIALVLVVTSLARTCPLYSIFGITTRHKHAKNG